MLLKTRRVFRHHRNALKNRVAEIQQLEPRTLPASSTVAVVQTGVNLTLTGDNKSNDVTVEIDDFGVTITAGEGTSLKFNGVADDDGVINISVPDGVAIGAVIANLKGGGDVLKVNVAEELGIQSIKSLSVDTGDGSDEVTVSVGAGTTLNFTDAVSLLTGDGFDTLVVDLNDVVNVAKTLTVNSGPDRDEVTFDLDDRLTVTGAASFLTGDGEDELTIRTNDVSGLGSMTFGSTLTINTGEDSDELFMSFAEGDGLTVKGLTTITTADGDDAVEIFNESVTLDFQKGLAINTGSGSDKVTIAGNEEEEYVEVEDEFGEFVTVLQKILTGGGVLHVAGTDLSVNTGSGEDEVSIVSKLALDLGLNITTGDDEDRITITTDVGITESSDTPATVANLIKGNLTIDAGGDSDEFALNAVSATSLSVSGTAAITTADGDDQVRILNASSTLNFLKGLAINTATGADEVTIAGTVTEEEIEVYDYDTDEYVLEVVNILNGGGVLHVAGADLVINTGNGEDDVSIVSKLALDLGLNITTGDGNDDVTITTDTGITVTPTPASPEDPPATPAPVANLIKGNLSIDTGDDEDNVDLEVSSATSLSVNGTAAIKTGLGDDHVDLLHYGTTVTFLKGLTIDTGSTAATASGEDLVHVYGDDYDEVAEEITYGKLNITGLLKITTGALADEIDLYTSLTVTGDLILDTGSGNDDVYVNFGGNVGTPGAVAANTLGSLTVNSGSGSDYVDIGSLKEGTVQVGGNVSLTTGTGLDDVSLFAFANFTIVKDLNIDTGSGDDHVGLLAIQGSFRVNGSEKILLGDDDDCFIQGTATAIEGSGFELPYSYEDDPEATFLIVMNGFVQGGSGDDVIGFAGVQIGLDKPTPTSALPASLTTLDLGAGDDTVAAYGVTVRDLKIIGGPAAGDGNDRILAEDVTIRGTTNIDLGSGDDSLLIRDTDINDNVTILGGTGDDGLGIGDGFVLAVGKKLTLNGGTGANSLASDVDLPVSAFSAAPINWMEEDVEFESIQADIERLFSDCLYEIE